MKKNTKKAVTKLRYLDLIREIGITDFKAKYNNSVLGYFWSLGKPLLLFLILYIVFYKFLKFGGGIPNFPVYLLVGIVFWSFFGETTSMAMHSVVSKGGLIRKVYFPREIIVISASLTSLLTFLLNIVVVFGFIFVLQISLRTNIVLLLPLILELYIFALGVSFVLSAMFVKYRDVGHIWEVVLQGMFYATPVIYVLSAIPVQFQGWLMLNPVAQIIQDVRYVLVSEKTTVAYQVLPNGLWLIPYAIVGIIFVVGVIYFRSAAASFAENI